MRAAVERIYCFGRFELEPELFELRRDGVTVAIQPRVFDLLVYLLRNAHRVVTRAELTAGPWNGTRVVPSALNQAVMLLRRELAAGDLAEALITVRQRGFQLRVAVTVRERRARRDPQRAHASLMNR